MVAKLIATVLTGNNENKIADAVASAVDFVDEVLLLDTGITDDTVTFAAAVAKGKLKVETIGWQNDFAWARNEALRIATAHGGTWAVTVDSDERLVFSGFRNIEQFRGTVDDDAVDVWGVKERGNAYSKERIFRLPAAGVWAGQTHEAYVGDSVRRGPILTGLNFYELPKTDEEYRHKINRDLLILLESTERTPTDARWWYYLGQTYQGMNSPGHAINAYREALKHDHWNEQRAWTRYQVAKCLGDLDQRREAIHECILGMEDDIRFPELPWMAAWNLYQLSRFEEAIHWSAVAASLGNFKGTQAGVPRISFRYLPAWYEAPYDVMRHSYNELGYTAEEAKANACFEEALKLREQSTNL